ncbi:uncharacterized protein LOC127437113 isoform X2 [Myxocyprinus asiaticus]|uniref:uncharacterized protein LOC127437113 isoform X2 n=1 Tax=Myxocyprinus asiaticus TaxID=70543 RepID=UPI002223A175|nr:uncharacterized protein LOC127437113 isoform X2 [Myxocyprinus asiaticus]XP_051547764.1 uncharacterized protein LOC127437113 isoform X2 [Myxocyprinus asiaticus]XP_051547765.1 uncharacterized protein LOC127437113 isoform X2 [Myxocyprinus asiaticus]XP_051547767.1 uncharacterized protein LOC127437113 isoform X2 [Myxocyprinus asiaticus]
MDHHTDSCISHHICTTRCRICSPLLLLQPKILFDHVIELSSHDADVRILIFGVKSDSRFRAADILLGRKVSRQMMKSEVMTDEGRVMMLITGPNLCEKNPASQDFNTALSLSSPGPHAVLITLGLEDLQSEQCDLLQQVQELLGAQVLQYCIVLLLQKDPQKPDRNTERVGEIIDACRGRFHIVTNSEPKPAQTTALLEEIHKLVWLNRETFYSTLNETHELETERLELLKRLREIETRLEDDASQDVNEENLRSSVIYDNLEGVFGILQWIFLISTAALVIFTKVMDRDVKYVAGFAAVLVLIVILTNTLSPDVAIPLNLALCSSLATLLSNELNEGFMTSGRSFPIIMKLFFFFLLPGTVVVFFVIMGLALAFGTIISIRTWSDVLVACQAAPGITIGAFAFLFFTTGNNKIPKCTEINSCDISLLALTSFVCCIVGATLSMGCVTVFALLGVKMTIILLILAFTIAYFHFNKKTVQGVICLTVLIPFFSCCCVFIGSVILILVTLVSFLKLLIYNLLSSYLFYVALMLGSFLVIKECRLHQINQE